MKRIISLIVATALLISGAAIAAAALELVRDGGFDSGLNEWTILSGTGEMGQEGGECEAGAARLFADSGDASYYQCNPLPAEASNWTLSADMSASGGDTAAVTANFYSSADCAGGTANVTHSVTIEPSTNPSPESFTYSVAGVAQSVEVLLKATNVESPDSVSGCFDNISLVANDAVAVTLTGMQAESGPPLPLAILLAVGLGVIVSVALFLGGRQRP